MFHFLVPVSTQLPRLHPVRLGGATEGTVHYRWSLRRGEGFDKRGSCQEQRWRGVGAKRPRNGSPFRVESLPSQLCFDGAGGSERCPPDYGLTSFSMHLFVYYRLIVNILDAGKVDLVMNVVERPSGGFSAGGGISSRITSGPLSGLIGSFAYSHRNLFGRNQKLNISLERGQIESIFCINYTDPWIERDDKRASRTIIIQNSRTPGTLVHGNQHDNSSLSISRVPAGIEFSRPLKPKWSGIAGLIFQHTGAHDEKGNPIMKDFYGSPLTASGKPYDDMLVAEFECVYTGSGDQGSSMFAFNMEQGLPVMPGWLFFNRVNARARKGVEIGPTRLLLRDVDTVSTMGLMADVSIIPQPTGVVYFKIFFCTLPRMHGTWLLKFAFLIFHRWLRIIMQSSRYDHGCSNFN
ncbi:hypothetical protein PVK06_012081 [Gossypium arboreum]|uniref:Bacterial surface antigen (D15) domain-containing protein n=1 Tax=Gossypium arboreum TaxID=29729 RepID=A0ABR0QAW8_GOSAR|nr:hypothetical protein PVK06_012081 [Gossypium arboreum]